jgi:hypothetical protein
MNSLVSSKCAGRLFMALAAISGIFLAAGCGNGSSFTPPNNQGFSNSSLNGTYVFSSQGFDSIAGAPLNLAGTLVANGTGSITGGTIDVVDADCTSCSTGSGVAQAITGGTYSISPDGRGLINLVSSYGTFSLDVVLSSTSQGLVTEFDSFGGGSGTIDLQAVVSSLAGPYAFSLAGSDSSGDPIATAGAFTLNSGGSITEGVEDFNDSGINYPGQALTGAATLGTGTSPGAITLTTSSFPGLTYDLYPIDTTHFKVIETDYTNYLAGDAFTQTGFSTIPTGTLAFTMLGGIGTENIVANGGYMTYSGNTFTGNEDVNDNGSVSTAAVPFTGTATAGGSVGSRFVVNLTNFVPNNAGAGQWVVYPSSGGLLMLEMDNEAVTNGAAYAQTSGAALAASQGYGLNLNAFNASQGYAENDIAQFDTTSSAFNGIIDINDNTGGGNSLNSIGLSATYTLDSSPATGRGEAITTAGGDDYISFTFYSVTNSQFLLLETDGTNGPIGAQIGTGTFLLQSGSAGVEAAQSHAAIVHPVVHPRAAHRHKASQKK